MNTQIPALRVVPFIVDEGVEVIAGHGTFNLLAVEELLKAIAIGAPRGKFGIAFSEGSDERLLRQTGNDDTLIQGATRIVKELNAGHFFVILMRDAFPIQVLNNVKALATTVNVQVASGNSIKAIVADIGDVSAVIGIADGGGPTRLESAQDRQQRRAIVRKIGYLESDL